MNNAKQLQIAYELYATDNGNNVMDNSVSGVASPGAKAWIQGNVQSYAATYADDPKNGVLYPYNTSLGIYKCPASRAFLMGVGRGRHRASQPCFCGFRLAGQQSWRQQSDLYSRYRAEDDCHPECFGNIRVHRGKPDQH